MKKTPIVERKTLSLLLRIHSLLIVFIPLSFSGIAQVVGDESPCLNATSNYSTVTAGPYLWSVVGGTIVGSNTNDNVDILWDNPSGPWEVEVEIDGGTTTESLTTITVNTPATPTLNVPPVVCENTYSAYYTTESGMSNYIWSVSGQSGYTQGTSTDYEVYIDWGAAGPGLVSVSYTDANGCLTSTTTQNVTIEATPVPSVTSGPASVCEYQTGTFYYTQPGQTGYYWNISGGNAMSGGGSTDDFVEVSWETVFPGSVEVSYSSLAGCIGSPDFYAVDINPLPIGASDNTSVCSNQPLSYDLQLNINTNGNAEASSFEWYAQSDNPNVAGESLSAQTTGYITDNLVNVTGTPEIVVYTVTPTSLSGSCAGTPFTVTVTVSPEPVGNSGTEPAACSQTLLNINPETYITNGLTGNNYSWSASYDPGLLGGAGTGGSYINETLTNTASATLNAYYLVTPMSSGGCLGTSYTITVPIEPEPVGSNATATTVCSGTALNVDPSLYIINGVTATFTWTASYGGMSGGSGSGVGTITETLTNTGSAQDFAIYTITPTSTGSCNGLTFDITVPIDPQPDIAQAGIDQGQCDDSNFTLNGNNPIVGTGVWSVVSGSASITTPTQYNTTVTGVPVGTTAILRWSITSGTCPPSEDDVELTNEEPPVVDAGIDQEVCGLFAALNGNTPTSGSVSWSLIDGPGTESFSDDTSPTTGVNVTLPGIYTFRWSAGELINCSTQYDEVVITFHAEPDLSFVGADQTQCNNDAFTLSANTPTVGSGEWEYVSGFMPTITDVNDPNTTVSGLTAGNTVTLRWVISNGTCAPSSDEVVLTNDAAPDVANAGGDDTVCGLSYGLNGNAPAVGTGQWTQQSNPPGGVTTFSPDENFNLASADVNMYGTYTYRWTISNGSCTASFDEVLVTFEEPPSISDAGIDQQQCGNDSFVMAANTPTVGTGEWQYVSGDATFGIIDLNNPNTTVSGIEAGNSITLRWIISNGTCTSSMDDITLTNGDTPTTSNAGTDQTQCNNDSFILSANTPVVGTGMWQYVSGYAGITITDANNPNTTVTGLLADNGVTLRWSISSGGCTPSESDVTLTNYGAVSLVPGANPAVCEGSTQTDFYYSSMTGLPDLYTIDFDATAEGQGFADLSDQPLGYPITISVPGGGAEGVYNALLTIRNSVSGCADASYPITVSIEGSPTPDAGVNQDVCGLTANLAAVVPSSGTADWSIKGGAGGAIFSDVNDPLSSVTVDTYGAYQFRWNVETACTLNSAEITVIFSEPPAAADAGIDITQCDDGNFVMAANTPTVGTGTWTYVSGDAGITIVDAASETTQITGLASNSGVTLRWSVTNGTCVSQDDVVLSNSTTPAGSDDNATICSGDALNYDLQNNVITLGNGVISTFDWVAIGDNPNITGESLGPQTTATLSDILISSSTTIETVDYSVAPTAGCPGTAFIVTVTINPTPTVSVTNNTPGIVSGGTTDIALSGTVAGTVFDWSVTMPGPITGGTSSNGTQISDVLVNSGATDEIVNYTISPSANGCFGTDQNTNVTVSGVCLVPPTIDAGLDATICEGSNVVLSATMGGASTVTWATGGDGTYNDNTLLAPTYTPSALDILAGNVTLNISTDDPDGVGPCTFATDNIIITINPAATVDAGFDQAICEGGTVTLGGTQGGSSTSISWSSLNGGSFDDNTNLAAIYTPSAAEIVTQTATLTISSNDPDGAGPCAVATDDIVVAINPAATTNAGLDQLICESNAVALASGIGGSASAITWATGGDGTFDNNTSLTAVYTPSALDILAGNVTLTISTDDPDGVGPCTFATDNIIITINNAATVAAGADDVICEGAGYALSGSFGGAAASSEWSIVSGTGSFDNTASPTATYTPSVGDVGTTVVLQLMSDDPTGPCPIVNDQVSITINQAATVDAGLDISVCEGNIATLSGTIGGSATTSVWSVVSGDGTITDVNALSTDYTHGGADIGSTATLQLTTSDPAGPCPSATDQVIVSVGLAAAVNAGTDVTICEGSPANLNAIISGGASSAVWSITTGTGSFNDNISLTPVYTHGVADAGTTATLELVTNDPDGAGPCIAATDQVLVIVNPTPNVVITNSNTTINTGEQTNISLSGAIAGTTFSWTVVGSAPELSGFSDGNGNSIAQTLVNSGAAPTVATYTITPTANTCVGVAQFTNVTVNGITATYTVIPSDSLALVALYNATNGATWTNSTNWLTGNADTWYGVTVSGNRVTQLNLAGNNLAGSIPAEVGDLTLLTNLNLSNNQLSGPIPAEFGDLTSLTMVRFNSNQLSGSIPAEFGNLAALTYADLHDNQLTGALPGEIGNLTLLTYLNLNINQLSGSIPAEFGNLTLLTGLHLGSNQLNGSIPAELGNMISLTALDLSSNQISGFIPIELGNLTSLGFLGLGNNLLSGSIPAEIGNLTALYYLDLSRNQLNGMVPVEFSNLTSLSGSLFLNDNNLTSLPNLSSLPGDVIANVSGNNLTFESIEPNVSLAQLIYTPQKNVGVVTDTLMQTDATLQLQYTIGGTANQYAWLKNGSPITGETTNALTLDNLAFEDEGIYQLRITNTTAPLLTLLTNPVTLHVSSLQRDSLSLVAVYNATGGVNWTTDTNWLTGNVSTWSGVVVTNNRVVAVNLSNNNVIGDIPPAITEMLALENLDLSGNDITSLPDLTVLPELQMLDVSDNMLDFSSLEQNAEILTVDYLNQADLGVAIDTLVRVNNEYTISIVVGGTNNEYQWKLNGNNIAGATTATYTIPQLNRAAMGTYVCAITNADVPGLVLVTAPNQVLAIAELRGTFYANQTVVASGNSYVELFEVQEGGFPKRDSISVSNTGTFTFDSVVLGDYQIRATADIFQHPGTIPTYYINTIFWEEADTILVDNDKNNLDIIAQGGIEEPSPTATGVISGVVEEDYGTTGRTNVTKRVGGAGVSARRTQGTGRGEEEVLTLVAYVFTNDQGEFLIDKLEPAEYLINIQLPGFPMNEESDVRVTVGSNPLDEAVTVEATVADGEISVRKLIVTGLEQSQYKVDAFPNPADQYVNVIFERPSKTRSVSITDLKGHTLKQEAAEGIQHQMDVRDISNGLYVLTISEAGKSVAYLKLIIK